MRVARSRSVPEAIAFAISAFAFAISAFAAAYCVHPLDKMLIAETQIEEMTLAIADSMFNKYDISLLWAAKSQDFTILKLTRLLIDLTQLTSRSNSKKQIYQRLTKK